MTLRRWDAAGIFVPERTPGNQRRYTTEQLNAFKAKQSGKGEGETPGESGQTDTRQINPSDIPNFIPNAYTYLADRKEVSSVTDVTSVRASDFDPSAPSESLGKRSSLSSTFLGMGIFLAVSGIAIALLSVEVGLKNDSNYIGLKQKAAGMLGIKTEEKQNRITATIDERVLQASRFQPEYIFTVNIPSIFRRESTFEEGVNILGGIQASGSAIFYNGLSTDNQDINAGTGSVFAANIPTVYVSAVTAGTGVTITGTAANPIINATPVGGVTSVNGQTGAVSFTAGSGLSLSGTEFSNSDKGSSQNIFKNIDIGASTIVAASNNDTLEFIAGSGITLTPDATNKTITVAASSGTSGWTDSGTAVVLDTITDSVGIGTTGPDAPLDILNASSAQLRLTHTDGTVYSTFQTNASGNLIVTTTGSSVSFSGLTVSASDFSCSNCLDFSELANTLNLDADLAINPTASNYDINIDSNTLFVDSGNNRIGIGTSTPDQELDVSGNLQVSGSTTFNTIAYVWPGSQGGAGTVLTNDGSGNLSWGNAGGGGGATQWTQTNGALYPNISTLDLLVGGNATTSAKFGFLNNASGTPVASVSAQNAGGQALSLDAAGNIQTARNAQLTIGGSTTGNIAINPLNESTSGIVSTTGDLTVSGGDIVLGTTSIFSGGNTASLDNIDAINTTTEDTLEAAIDTLNNLTSATSLASVGTITAGTWSADVIGTEYGGTGQNFGATAQGSLIYFSSSGVMSALGPGTAGQVLTTNGAAQNPSWTNADNLGLWNLVTGAYSPKYASTVDLLLGSSATASAKFGVLNILTGTPTATISANSGNNASFLTGTGNLGTTNSQTLTLGGAGTGDVLIQPNGDTGDYFRFASDGTSLTLATTDASNLTLNPAGTLQFYSSSNTIDSSGDLTLAGVLDINGGGTHDIAGTLNLSGNTLTSTGDLTINATDGNILFADGDALNVGGAAAAAFNFFAGATTNNATATDDNDLYIEDILEVDGAVQFDSSSITFGNAAFENCGVLTTSSNVLGCGTGSSVSNWNILSGTIQPKLASTLDFLIGGTSTASAKFAVLNVENGTPTASVSSGLNGNSAYLTATGNLATQRMQTLSLGGTTTGNITIGTTGTSSLVLGNSTGTFALTSNGGLNVTTAGALTGVASIDTIAFSATAIGFAGAGSVTSDTTNALTLDSGTTGTVNLGTGNNAKTLNIGTGNAGNTINIGTNNTVADTIAIGSALDTLSLSSDKWSVDANGNLTLGEASATQGSLVLANTSANSVTIKSSNSTTGSYTLTLPVNDGDSGFVLSTDGSGVLSWTDTSTGGSIGPWTLSNNVLYPDATSSRVGVGTTTTGDVVSQLYITRNQSDGATGKALAIFNQTENQNIIAASSSGTTVFTLGNDGTVTLFGNLALSSDNNEGISGGGLTDCDDATGSKLLWDATTNKFSCGTDSGSGSGGSKWTESGVFLYPDTIGNQVGIGTQTTGDIISSLYVSRNLASGALGKAVGIFNQTESADIFAASASGTTRFVIKNDGSVGINTANPESLLEVQGAEGSDAILTLDADEGDDAADTWFIESEAADNDLSFVNGTTEAFKLTSSGNATIFGTTGLTLSGAGGEIAFANSETIGNDTDDLIVFTGAGGTNNTTLTIDLDGAGTTVPTLIGGASDLIAVNDSLSIGIDGATTENINEVGFALADGNDLYVDDMLGVNGNAFIDGTLDVDGAVTFDGAVSANSTLTVAGDFAANANTTLGDAITDTLTFTARVAQDSDLIPITATGTNDLGSSSLPWDNLYVNDITLNGAALGNHWNYLNGALVPKQAATTDLLFGGTASSSAKFAVLNITNGTPTASISATGATDRPALVLGGDGVINTVNKGTLTLGTSQTGNILIGTDATARSLTIGNTTTTTALTLNAGTGDINLTSGDDIFFDDTRTGAIPFSVTDTELDAGLTNGIIDAINEAYTAATGGGGSGVWSVDNGTLYPTTVSHRVGVGTTADTDIISSLYVTHNLGSGATGKAVAIFNQTETQDILTASASGSTRFTLSSAGDISFSGGDITGANSAAIDLGEANSGDLTLGASVDIIGPDDFFIGLGAAAGRLVFDSTAAPDEIDVQNATLDLNTNLITNIGNAGTDFTSGGGLTLAGTLDADGDVQIADTNIAFDHATATTFSVTGTFTVTPGGQMTLGATGQAAILQGTTLALTSNGANNDISLTSADDISFDDAQLGSAITLTDEDTSLPNNNTGIVDAINDAYNAATGTGGVWTLSSGKIYPGTISNQVGIGTTTDSDIVSSFYVTRNLAAGALGKSLVILNQTENQNILTASASGTTVANITRAGGLQLTAGEGVDVLSAGELEFGNTTATTVNIGNTAATTLALGAGGSLARTINIGTGTGVDTINIGTGGTGADVIRIGDSAADLELTDANWSITTAGVATFTQLNTDNLRLDGNTFSATSGDITLDADGNIIFADGDTLNVGGAAAAAFNFFASDTSGNNIANGDDDLFIGDDLEVQGHLRLDGTFSLDSGNFDDCTALTTDADGDVGCSTTTLGSNWNVLATGVITPKLTSTLDFLLGSTASSSAKFAVLNVADGTPVASVSSGLNGNSAFLTAGGNLATQRMQSLTLGGATTGFIGLNSGSGAIGLEDDTFITGTFSPIANDTYALGSSALRFNSLFLSDNSGVAIDFNSGGGVAGTIRLDTTDQLTFANFAAYSFSTSAFATLFDVNEPPAAGGSGNLLNLDPTLNAMDGSDTVRGLFVDLTNANHTGSSNVLVGIDVDAITGDAEATEVGLRVGTGWDFGAQINGTTQLGDLALGFNDTSATITTVDSEDLTIDPLGDNVLFSDGTLLNVGGAAAAAFNFFAGDTSGNTIADGDSDLYIQDEFEVDGAVRFDSDTITLGHGDFENCGSLQTSSNALTCGSASSFSNWTVANGTISPRLASTLDLLIGGTATTAAKFAVLNVADGTPVASVSSGLSGNSAFLTADGNLATQRMQTLTLGGTTTGNIVLNAGSGSIELSDTTDLGANLLLNIGNAGTDFTSGGGLTLAGAFTANGNLTLGNETSDTITFTGSVATDSDLIPVGTSGTNDLGSSSIPWDNLYVDNITLNGAALGNHWNYLNGALIPKQAATTDLLLGATASSSAKFAVLNITNGTPVASVSSGLSGNSAFLTAGGNLATQRMQSLTLGGATTGNIQLHPGSGGVTTFDGTNTLWSFGDGGQYGTLATTIGSAGGSANALSIQANDSSGDFSGALINLRLDGTNTNGFSGDGLRIIGDTSQIDSGTGYAIDYQDDGGSRLFGVSSDGTIELGAYAGVGGRFRYITGDGLLIDSFAAGVELDITLNAQDGDDTTEGIFIDIVNANHTGSNNFLYGLGIDSITADDESTEYAINIASGWDRAINAAGEIAFTSLTDCEGIQTDGSGVLSCTAGGGATSNWNVLNGTIQPKLTSTLDLLLGGTASTAAKFAVLNIADGTPTASISATGATDRPSLVLSSAGTINTVNKGSLTLGSSGTGNILVGTDATARTLTLGNTTTTSAVNIDSGTGGIALASTSTGDITINSADTLLLDSAGVLELNSSGGVISIGNDAVAQNINIGNGAAARIITIGNNTTTTGLALTSGTGDVTISSTDQIIANSSKAAGGTTTEAISLKSTADLDVGDELLQIGDSGGDFLTVLGTGRIGIGTTGPDSLVDILRTSGSQLRLTHTDSTDFADFTVDENGKLTIAANGGFEFTGGSITASDFVCSDCLNFGEIADSAELDANWNISASASNFDINIDSNTFVIDSSENRVGIGTTAPESLLEIQGAEGADAILTLDADDGDDAADTWFIESEAADNDLSFVNATTEVAKLTSAGALAIEGALSDLSGDLEIADNTDITGELSVSSVLQVGSATTVGYSRFGTGTTGHSLDAANDVLISDDLEVDGDIFQDGNLYAPASGISGYWQRQSSAISPTNVTDDVLFGATATSSAKFALLNMAGGTPTASAAGNLIVKPWTNGGTQTGGFLGIGTTSPSYHLDLNTGRNDYLAQIYNTNAGSSAGGLSIRIDGNGNLLNLNASGTDIFTVNPQQATIGVPTQFTASGDISIAYDLLFTNPTASYIDSAANLSIRAGETFNSSNLTLQTYNSGTIILDAGGGVQVDMIGTATAFGVCHDGADVDAGNATDRTLVACSTTAADYMELYPVASDLQKGDIAVIGSQDITTTTGERIKQLVKSTFSYQNGILGVVSDASQSGDFNSIGHNIRSEDNPQPIALSGRVPVKVTTENGTIQAGDYISSSSKAGIGMKATQAGFVIGQALEEYSNSDTGAVGTVMIFVRGFWHDPNTYVTASGNLSSADEILQEAVDQSIAQFNQQQQQQPEEEEVPSYDLLSDPEYITTKTKVDVLGEDVTELDQKLADLASSSALLADLVNTIASGSAFPTQDYESFGFTGESATLSGTLNVLGRTTLNDLGVTGTITAGILSIDGINGEINTIGEPLKLQSFGTDGIDILDGKITIDTDGNLTTEGKIVAEEVEAKKFIVDTDSETSTQSGVLTTSAGSVTIEAGETSIDINTSALTADSLIFATPDRPVAVGTRKKDSNTFTITLENAPVADIKVNWWIVN